MNALSRATGDVFRLRPEYLAEGLAASRESPRRRIILPIHRDGEAPVQRMLNFLQPGTYVQPHLHPSPGAIETVSLLQGRLGMLRFDPQGTVTGRWTLEPEAGAGLIDLEPRVWHGLVVLAPDTVILEIKHGPYRPESDKVFASWAPAEGDDAAPAYLTQLERHF